MINRTTFSLNHSGRWTGAGQKVKSTYVFGTTTLERAMSVFCAFWPGGQLMVGWEKGCLTPQRFRFSGGPSV